MCSSILLIILLYHCIFFFLSRCVDVRGRDADVLVPNTKAGRQAQAVLRPQHGPTQHAAARATQEQEEVSTRIHTNVQTHSNVLVRFI